MLSRSTYFDPVGQKCHSSITIADYLVNFTIQADAVRSEIMPHTEETL